MKSFFITLPVLSSADLLIIIIKYFLIRIKRFLASQISDNYANSLAFRKVTVWCSFYANSNNGGQVSHVDVNRLNSTIHGSSLSCETTT